MKNASLHSIETMGMVDGPGIRTVFFLQGCSLKCGYCHNPDTQHFMGTNKISIDEVLETALRFKSYYDATEGGVTFSGGEALMQGEFVAEAFRVLKQNGISTCLDTSGFGVSKHYDAVLANADYVLLDIKEVEDAKHLALTGQTLDGVRKFMKHLKNHDCSVTIRHVMVPGQTDSHAFIDKLLEIISPIGRLVDQIEILPYHKSGVSKYEALNLPYLFDTISEMDPKVANIYEVYANQRLKEVQSKLTQPKKAV